MTATPPVDFSVEVHQALGRTIVRLAGDLDESAAPVLREKLSEVMATGALEVVVDLRSLRFLDSSGLRALIGATATLRQMGGDLVLSGPSDDVWRVFEVTGLSRSLTITRN